MSTSRPYRVLIADDHAPLRRGVRVALEDHGFRIVAECDNAESAVAAAERSRPDVCVVDLRMPGGGIAAIREITMRVPKTKIVILTVSRDERDLFAALQAGADGYLLKGSDPTRLAETIRSILHGEGGLDPSLVPLLINEFRRRQARTDRLRELEEEGVVLTRREWEVLELLESGNSTAEIAQELHVTPPTVRSHVATVLKKLHAGSREEALRRLR